MDKLYVSLIMYAAFLFSFVVWVYLLWNVYHDIKKKIFGKENHVSAMEIFLGKAGEILCFAYFILILFLLLLIFI